MSWNLPLQIQRIQAEINEITLAGPVQNPMLAPLNANNNDISNIGVLTGTTLNAENINVTNFSTLGLNVSDLTVYADLHVEGGAIYGHDCYLDNNLRVSNTTILHSNTTLASNLSVSGSSIFNNNVTMLGNLSVGGIINWNTFNPPIAESAGNTFLLLGNDVKQDTNNFLFSAADPQSGIECLQFYGQGDAYAVYTTIGNADTIAFGLSSSPIGTYPPSSGNFYSLIDYGIYLYPNVNAVYVITNGVLGASVPFTFIPSGTGTQTGINISLTGTTMTVKLNGIVIAGLQQTVPTGSYTLLSGGFTGGTLNGVIWGQITNPTLSQVLNSGNNGSGQTIQNVNINANSVYSSGYLEVGNAVSDTSQIHLFYQNGTETGNNWQIVGSAGGLQCQYYETSAPPAINALTLNKSSNIILCDASNTNPTVQINGSSGLGRVYDTVYNPVSSVGNIDTTATDFTLNYPTQQLPKGYATQFVSLLEFTFPNNYNNFVFDLNNFSFVYSYNTNVIQSLDVIFFLSSTKNGAGVGDQKGNITIVNPSPTATNNSYTSPITETLTLRTTSPTNTVYLNVANSFTLDPDMYIGFTAFTVNMVGQLSNSNAVTPTVTIPS